MDMAWSTRYRRPLAEPIRALLDDANGAAAAAAPCVALIARNLDADAASCSRDVLLALR